ncbi:hypothetical protein NG726_14950 [Pseudomonas sp. MOB-449]|nr:hypothetical protein [Pseudomonas sp. MOB-449]
MTTALLSFLGIIAGAALQYIFTRHLESQRYHRDLRTQAYIDYLKSVCEQAILSPQPLSSEEKELRAKMANSKSRICLYGSEDVVSSLAEFEKLGSKLTADEQRNCFARMVLAMRIDSKGDSKASVENLEIILMGA